MMWVPVISASEKPLMPCRPSKARKLITKGLAKKRWNKLGQFFLQLNFEPKSKINKNQHMCLSVDPGARWDGLAVVSREHVQTTGELILPSSKVIVKKLKNRRQMRRNRRYRKCPRRTARFSNRHRHESWIAPSQKAKVDFRIEVISKLCKLYPVTEFVVEDVKFNHYKKRWGKHFSTVEIGKTKFYNYLRKLGDLKLYKGVETSEWREKLGLPKNSDKSALKWDAHASDAIAIGCAEIGCVNPLPSEFIIWRRYQYPRRQLHYQNPLEFGKRRPFGGSLSIKPFKKGDVVLWHRKLRRVSGHTDNYLTLCSFSLKYKRINNRVKPKDCTRLFNQQIFNERQIIEHSVKK